MSLDKPIINNDGELHVCRFRFKSFSLRQIQTSTIGNPSFSWGSCSFFENCKLTILFLEHAILASFEKKFTLRIIYEHSLVSYCRSNKMQLHYFRPWVNSMCVCVGACMCVTSTGKCCRYKNSWYIQHTSQIVYIITITISIQLRIHS